MEGPRTPAFLRPLSDLVPPQSSSRAAAPTSSLPTHPQPPAPSPSPWEYTQTRPRLPESHHPCHCSAPLPAHPLAPSILVTLLPFTALTPSSFPPPTLCICCSLCLECSPQISTQLAPSLHSGLRPVSPLREALPDYPLSLSASSRHSFSSQHSPSPLLDCKPQEGGIWTCRVVG